MATKKVSPKRVPRNPARKKVVTVKQTVRFSEAQKVEIAGIVAEALAAHERQSADVVGERLARLKVRPKKTMINFRLEDVVLDALEAWAKRHGMENRTDAIKALILSAK